MPKKKNARSLPIAPTLMPIAITLEDENKFFLEIRENNLSLLIENSCSDNVATKSRAILELNKLLSKKDFPSSRVKNYLTKTILELLVSKVKSENLSTMKSALEVVSSLENLDDVTLYKSQFCSIIIDIIAHLDKKFNCLYSDNKVIELLKKIITKIPESIILDFVKMYYEKIDKSYLEGSGPIYFEEAFSPIINALELVPQEQIKDMLNLLASKLEDRNEFIRELALKSITKLATRIPEEQITKILDLLINKIPIQPNFKQVEIAKAIADTCTYSIIPDDRIKYILTSIFVCSSAEVIVFFFKERMGRISDEVINELLNFFINFLTIDHASATNGIKNLSKRIPEDRKSEILALVQKYSDIQVFDKPFDEDIIVEPEKETLDEGLEEGQLIEQDKFTDEITYQEKLLLLQRIDLDKKIQVQTIEELRHLINLRQIPKDSISLYQTLDLFIEKAEVDIPAVTRQALFGIRNIAITYGIPKDRNDLVISLLVSKLNYGRRQEKYSSVKTIGELVKTNQILKKDFIKIFNLMLENVNDKSETISTIALNCIRQLLIKMKIASERAEYAFDLLIDKIDSKFDSTKCVAMQGIRNIAGRYIIPVDKIKEALGILTDHIDSSHNKVQRNAIEGIGIFIKQDKVAYSDLGDTLELISLKTADTGIVSIASFKVLFNNLKNNNYSIRENALNALLQVNYQDEQIISNLKHFIQIDGSEQIREIAKILKSSSSERHNIILDIIQQRGIFEMDRGTKALSQKSEANFESEDIISSLIYRIKFSSYKERFVALRELSKLIKNNEIPEDRLKETFDLLLSYSSRGGDMVGGLARHWAVQLLDRITASEIEIEHIINLLLSHINDSTDQGSGSVKSIVKLIEIRIIPENRIKEIFECLKIKISSSNKKVSNKAIEGIRLLEEMTQIQRSDSASEISHSTIDSPEEVMIEVRTINTGLSELDLLISQVGIIKNKKDIKQVWKKIEKFIKNRSISDKKAEEFLSFLETKAMGNPGRTAKKSLKAIEILIDKYDISFKSAEHLLKLIQKQFYKENVSQQKLIKLINILAQKNLIPEVLKDEILDLLRSSLSKVSSKMAKSITEGIKFIAESVPKEPHIQIKDDIKETGIDTCALTNELSQDLSQELRLTKISYKDINKLKFYVDQLTLESTNIHTKIEALSAIKKLISKNRILETDIDFIIQLLMNKAIHQDQGVRHEAILAIVAVINKYTITNYHHLTNILNLLIAAANNNPPVNTDALQGIANFIMKDYLPEEKIDEVFNLLMLKANQKYIWAKAAAIRGITRLIEKEKLHHEYILKVIELLIYNIKYGPEKIDAIALKGIGILANNNKFAEESIEDILILLINKAKNGDRSAKNNALDAITIITKKYNLTQKLIPEVLELVLNISQQTDPKAEQLVEVLKENYKILEFLVSLFESSDTEYKKCAVQIVGRLNYSGDQIIFNLESIISREYLKSKILSDLFLLKAMLTDRVDLIEILNSKIDTLESIEFPIRDQVVNEASTIQHIDITEKSDISVNQDNEVILLGPSLKIIKPLKLRSEEIDIVVSQICSSHGKGGKKIWSKLNQLLLDITITNDKADSILTLLIAKIISIAGATRSISFSAIDTIVSKYDIYKENVKSLLYLLYKQFNYEYAAKSRAMLIVDSLIIKNLIPEEMVEEVLTLLYNQLNDAGPNVVINALKGIDILSRNKHQNKIEDIDIPDNVIQESLKQAVESNIIGSRVIEGFDLKDVNDVGNCFYEAVIDQMQLLGHVFLESIPYGTAPHDSLRLAIQGSEFKDQAWADDQIIDKFVLLFSELVLAVIDTKNPQLGFVCYYADQSGEIITNIGDNLLPNKMIIRIASTGNHFLSVINHPAILNGAIKDEFYSAQLRDKVENIGQSKYNEEITSLTSSIKTISLLRDNSGEMAKLVLARGKLLLKANTLPSSDSDLEQEFINELAMCLRVVYKNLLELSERNQDLKLNFIKKLASELKKEEKIYIKDGKFTINEELQEDSEVFFSSAIISVKEQLKQHTYFDELSNVVTTLEIRCVTKFEYYSENLLLCREELIYEAGQIGGIEAINKLIELGEDSQVANALISAAKEYGTQNILNILFASQRQMNEPIFQDLNKLPEISNTQDNTKFYTEGYYNNLVISSLVVKEAVETIPMIKYVINDIFHIHYSWPEFIDNNYFKISLHNIAVNVGIYSLTGKIDIFASSFSTTIYGGRILAYEYLANQKQINFQNQEDKSIDSPNEFIEKCGFDMLAQTSLGVIGSLISGSPMLYDVVISASVGSMQCYSLYNQEEKQDISPTIVSTVIPYIMDSIVVYASIKNMQFDLTSQFGQMLAVKQSFALMSAIVMTDYTTKLFMNSIGDQLYEYCNDITGNIYGYIYGDEN